MSFIGIFFRDSASANDGREIFDTHCHLNAPELIDHIQEHIFNAVKGKVKKMLVVGYDYQSSLDAIQIAEQYECCYAAIGFQPEEIKDVSKEQMLDLFKNHLNHKRIVAIGEIGLDYHFKNDEETKKKQKEFFIEQIKIANENRLPITVHCRDAMEDCLQILKKYKPLYGGIMHCFSGSVELMHQFIDLGMLISLGGPVTFRNAKTPKEVAEEVPLDKLVVETDSPYLSPDPVRGTLNTPYNVNYVIEEIARIKQMSKKHLEEATCYNACKLFHV